MSTIETHKMDDREFDAAYKALSDATEFWIVFGRDQFAFRFGPFKPAEVGEQIKTALEKNLACTIIGVCGREIDWQLADDMGCWLKGHPPRDPKDA